MLSTYGFYTFRCGLCQLKKPYDFQARKQESGVRQHI